MKFLAFLVFFVCLLRVSGQMSAHFVDNRDRRIYGQVSIGDQVWMQNNLNFNEDYRYFYFLSRNQTYYRWYEAVNDSICPQGWKIPSVGDWQKLVRFDEGDEMILNVPDESLDKLNITPAGHITGGQLIGRDSTAAFWTTDLIYDETAGAEVPAYVYIDSRSGVVSIQPGDETMRASCRCIRE